MSELTHLMTEVAAIVAGLYTLLRFVFEPRLKLAMQGEVTPVAERVGQLEHRASATDIRFENFELGQERTEKAIEKIGEQIGTGLENLATAIHELAGKHEATAKEVAELKGARAEAKTRKRR